MLQETECSYELMKDFFNYHAINLLELMGKIDPDQIEIDLIEAELKQICGGKVQG